MKRLGLSSKAGSAKRRKQEQPPLDTTAASSPCSPPPSFSSIVLDNPDIVGLVASFLRFGRVACVKRRANTGVVKDFTVSPHRRMRGVDNSLLRFALCCRRTHSIVMSDGPWWKRQWLCLDLKSPLVPLHEWSCLSRDNNTLALMVDGFGSRQQEVMRRLLGDEVYEDEVAPKLRESRSVRRAREERGLAAAGLISTSHNYAVLDQTACNVYPRLTPPLFDSLAQRLPEPCLEEIFSEPYYTDYPDVYWDDDDDKEYTDTVYNEPYCQWLLGC